MMDSHFLSWDKPAVSSITQDDYFLSWDRETIKKQEGFEKGGEPNNHDFLSWIRPSPNDELPVQNGQIAKDDDVDVGSIRVKDVYPRHELLGSRVDEGDPTKMSWWNVLETRETPWLTEYVFLNQTMFPLTGYISMAGEAVKQLSNGHMSSYILKDFTVTSALLLDSAKHLELSTTLSPIQLPGDTQQWYELKISSYDGDQNIERCVSKISPRDTISLDGPPVSNLKASLLRHVGRRYWYDVVADAGLQYGASFRGLDEISTSAMYFSAVASISITENVNHPLHPVTMDQCFQILMVAAHQGQGRKLTKLFVPTSIQELMVHGGALDGMRKLSIGGKVTQVGESGMVGDTSIMTEDGHLILSMKDCRTSVVPFRKRKAETKLLSFTKWDTDAGSNSLNRTLMPNQDTLIRTIEILAHKNPKLNVLEIGNGEGDITKLVLKALKSPYGERQYSTYTYAGSSSNASARAKKLLSHIDNIEVTSFNVDGSSKKPSLKLGNYHLIVISDLIHPTSNTKNFLRQSQSLIHPFGHLLVLQAVPELLPPATTNGGLRDGTFASQVHTSALECGFSFETEDDLHLASPNFVAQLKTAMEYPRKVTLIALSDNHPLLEVIKSQFQGHGIDCDVCHFEDNIPDDQDAISLVDFGEPYIFNFAETRFQAFVKKVNSFKKSMIWATPSAQISCKHPNTSMIIGLTRTLRTELRKDITTVELDTERTPYADLSKGLLKIYLNLGNRPQYKDMDPDYEYAIVDGEIKIPRLHWMTGEEEIDQHPEHPAAIESGSRREQSSKKSSTTPVHFRSDVCYLLVGGLGGLGREISRWMVENGARHILYLSRSAKEGPETAPFFDELRSQGCAISTFAGSVNNLKDVEVAVEQAPKPIAGVMQMSAVMRDNFLSQMTFSEWEECVRPKVEGTWNLHNSLSSSDLDFFLLFSSICGITGQWGQANYNAANSFLDAFVQYRHGLNLAASVVDIGFMGGVGMAMENSALVKKLKTSGYYFLSEADLIDVLAISIANSRPAKDGLVDKSHLALGITTTNPITTPAARVAWKKDARMAVSHHFIPPKTPSYGEVENVLNGAYRARKS